MHIDTTKVKGEVMVRTHLKDVHNRKLKGNCKPVCKSKYKLHIYVVLVFINLQVNED